MTTASIADRALYNAQIKAINEHIKETVICKQEAAFTEHRGVGNAAESEGEQSDDDDSWDQEECSPGCIEESLKKGSCEHKRTVCPKCNNMLDLGEVCICMPGY